MRERVTARLKLTLAVRRYAIIAQLWIKTRVQPKIATAAR